MPYIVLRITRCLGDEGKVVTVGWSLADRNLSLLISLGLQWASSNEHTKCQYIIEVLGNGYYVKLHLDINIKKSNRPKMRNAAVLTKWCISRYDGVMPGVTVL